jgi:transposase-like protein
MWQEATAIKVSEAMKEVKAFEWEGEDKGAARAALKGVIERALNNARDEYLAELASRDSVEEDRCNGYYPRHLLSAVGDVELKIPRTRSWSAGAALKELGRRTREVDQLILGCFVLGLSTRKVATALFPILGEKVSPSTVSRIAHQLDAAVAAYHGRPLKSRYRVLIFDAVVLKRKTGGGSQKRMILVALGITFEGKKEVIDFAIAPGESEGAWAKFFTALVNRGLSGEGVELIVVDGGKGLLAALDLVYPEVPVQRCWAHKARNVVDKVKKADQAEVKRDLNRISHAKNRIAAQKAFGRFARRWQGKYPKAVKCVREDIESLLEFYSFPADWRNQVRTTNAIERRFVEVRRRTRPMGVFSDRTSIERILFAVLMHENRKEGVGSVFLLTQKS